MGTNASERQGACKGTSPAGSAFLSIRTRANGDKNSPVLGTKTLAPRPLLQYFFPGYRCVMSLELSTDRLLIRVWELRDAEDALKIYGADEVARWLTPE